MRRIFVGVLLSAAAVLSLAVPAFCAEPSAGQLRDTIRKYIQRQEDKLGSFTVADPKENGKLRTLSLIRVHDRVGKTGEYDYSCTDMKDLATGEQLDLDFDVSDTDKVAENEDRPQEKLKVVAVRIHKDNGKPRYTYDDKDNLIPVS